MTTTPPPADDGAFARWLAARAGEELLALRAAGATPATGDKAAHQLLVAELAKWRPGDAVLSEEAVRDDVAARRSAARVWIVDPLDGSREYGEPGRTDWAVHVALWVADPGGPAGDGEVTGELVSGAVALPAQGRVLATDAPPPLPPAGPRLRIVVSRTRPPAFVTAVAAAVGAELIPMGSAGAKIAAVITGEADAYLHAGGQYEWDSAAPVAVARATGLHTSRVDGSRLVYNQAHPSLPDLLVCRPELAESLLTSIAAEESR
ncbi:MAG TPA: 3'(2'),5'-bisphosphate nucleotidase CysQ [Natronosporangium sp.]